MSKKLMAAEDMVNDTVFVVDIGAAVGKDPYELFKLAIEARDLAVAEVIREACAKVADDWEIETGGGVERDIRSIDLVRVLKGTWKGEEE